MLINDSGIKLKYSIDEISGFLTAPVTLARTGVQVYYGFELGIKDRALEQIGVYRPAEEVFAPNSLTSFINLVSTDDHPAIPVTTDNVKSLQVGQVSGVAASQDQRLLEGVLTITDAKVIAAIQGGKKEVSVGYAHKLVPDSGMFEGVKYEYVQRDIRANHLAIVTAGRCGSDCNISMDNKGEQLMKVTIAGISFDTDNEQLVQAISNMVSDNKGKVDALLLKVTAAETLAKDATAAKDAAEAKADLATKAVLTDDAINTLVNDRAVLMADALSVLGADKMPECKTCPLELKSAVVDHVTGLDLSGKSEEYVGAAYDMAMAQFKKGKENINNLNGDFRKAADENHKSVDADREKARAGYMKTKGLED